MADGPAPTFDSRTDRIVYLIGEFRYLVTGMVLGAIALVAYYQPSIPQPPTWVGAAIVAWLVLGIPCYLAGVAIARWLRRRNWVEVHHVDGRGTTETDIEKHYVPPETWRTKTVDGPDPYPVNGGSAWAVQEYEYLDDIGELRVKGVWLEGLEDTQLFTAQSMMVDMHGWMLDQIERLADTRAKWSRSVTQYEQETVNDFAEARERGTTLKRTTARDVFEDMTGDDEDIPSLDADEMPNIDDYTDGERDRDLDERMDRARQQQEDMNDD
ncbi:hypothetical protein HZS55_07710 [Halosimplex rubrum]|uniref:Uncharacterized protein n=1 Tax=Halosimplex rubrum TaxID=869889 RepID=A0A7D5NZL4_9EURY|nr:hypothetical protein [Halosimplex rubrum]QLH77186.1 hypothetical protein HZS55_07710 [Halosimplex rubrum]